MNWSKLLKELATQAFVLFICILIALISFHVGNVASCAANNIIPSQAPVCIENTYAVLQFKVDQLWLRRL